MTVATSDALEQVIITDRRAQDGGAGAFGGSRADPRKGAGTDCKKRPGQHAETTLRKNNHNYLFDHLPEELVSYMEEVRLGKREL